MRLYLAFLFAFVAYVQAKSTAKDAPAFHILSSRAKDGKPRAPNMMVAFANGVTDDIILKHYKMNKESPLACNYIGKLKNYESSVAVTGCMEKPGDRMEITLLSEHNPNHMMYTVDFFGNTQIVENPFKYGLKISRAVHRNREDDGDFEAGTDDDGDDDEFFNPAEEAVAEGIVASAVTVPSKLKAVVKFGYDQSIKDKLSVDFMEWVGGVMAHTQAHYLHSSLGTQIEFDVNTAALFKDAYWCADNNLGDAVTEVQGVQSSMPEVDMYAWWCDDKNWCGSTAGIAYVGTVCDSWGYGTSLNEYQDTTSAAAYVLAHEMGHNFGMSHDFGTKHGGTGNYWDSTNACNNQGIMSYGDWSLAKWSDCSVSDFKEHYESQGWGNGCLEDIGGGSTATTAAPGTEAPATEAPATTQAPAASCNDAGGYEGYVGDGECDNGNNIPECNYDGGDCCPPRAKTDWDKWCVGDTNVPETTRCKCLDPGICGTR